MAYKVKKGKENLTIYSKTKVVLGDATQKQLKGLYEKHKDVIEYIEDKKNESKPKKKNK